MKPRPQSPNPPPAIRSPHSAHAARPTSAYIARDVRLVHEDEHIIIVDKPVGLVTADPARASGPNMLKARPSAALGDTLFDYVKNYVRASVPFGRTHRRADRDGKRQRETGRVWVIHRLDKEASGLLVFAKTMEAFESLKDQFHDKSAHRVYIALAEGIIGPPGHTGTRESMILEDRGPSPGKTPTGRGRAGPKMPAITHYRVLAAAGERTLLQVQLETGRKNQIRIHMRELGHPLVGDRRFDAATDAIGRLGLHAAELGFKHPGTGEMVRFTSSPPATFYRAVGLKSAPSPVPPDVPVPPRQPVPDAQGLPHRLSPKAATSGGTNGGTSHVGTAPAADTSWDEVAGWYDTLLDDKGSDHYEQVILPGAIELLQPKPSQRILDVACGQGILSRRFAALGAEVTGVDAAPRLIEAARKRSPEIDFHIADARDLSGLSLTGFDAAACIMALSNIDPLEPVLAGIAAALKPGGAFVLIITHPAFRSPGQSHWGWDECKGEKSGRQYRRIDAYLTPYRKDIAMHPGKAAQGKRDGALSTPTFHRPLETYIRALGAAGLLVEDLREWPSKRAASSGPRAPEENRARIEIPLFLGVRAVHAEPRR